MYTLRFWEKTNHSSNLLISWPKIGLWQTSTNIIIPLDPLKTGEISWIHNWLCCFKHYGYRQRNTQQIYLTHRANFIKMFFLHSKTHIIFLFRFSPNQHSLPQWILSTFHLWPFNHVINLLPTNKYVIIVSLMTDFKLWI